MVDRNKIIAITQRVVEVPEYGEIRDCLDQEWIILLQSLGFMAIPIPNQIDSVVEYLKHVNPDGIVLSGGNNFTFAAYDSGVNSTLDAYECRDSLETKLLEYAIRHNVPVLGCCRGMQCLQVFFGGKLSLLEKSDVNHSGSCHEVVLTENTFEAMAKLNRIKVNSYHNYGIRLDGIAPQFRPFAICEKDSVVEGFAHRQYPFTGIMWHPERKSPFDKFNRLLIKKLFSGR